MQSIQAAAGQGARSQRWADNFPQGHLGLGRPTRAVAGKRRRLGLAAVPGEIGLTLSGDPLQPRQPHFEVLAAMFGAPEWTSSAF